MYVIDQDMQDDRDIGLQLWTCKKQRGNGNQKLKRWLDWFPRPQLTSSELVGQALGSHYAKYTTRITLFYQGKIAIIGVHKEIQMSIYPGKGGSICLMSNLVKKVGVRGCISW